MKKIDLYLLAILMMMIPVLQSCDDDDDYPDNYIRRIATVKVIDGNNYYLQADNGRTLFPVSTRIPWYKPVEGQRVIADYTQLNDNEGEYDYDIHVYFLRNILTKNVEVLTEENEEEIGDTPVRVYDMWISGNYLNVYFDFRLPANSLHRVSLVENSLVEAPDDEYIHLEYRYNDYNDVTPYVRYAMVSFNLGEEYGKDAAAEGYKGIKVRINSAVNGEKELKFDFPSQEDPINTKEITNSSELEEGKIR